MERVFSHPSMTETPRRKPGPKFLEDAQPFGFRIPRARYEELRSLSEALQLPVSYLIRQALEEFCMRQFDAGKPTVNPLSPSTP